MTENQKEAESYAAQNATTRSGNTRRHLDFELRILEIERNLDVEARANQ
jgi:hypothetical protein